MTTVSRVAMDQYRSQATELQAILEGCKGLYESLAQQTWLKTTANLSRRLSVEAFKVLVIGEFKRGKSTFINALLSQEVLPAFATPCTAVINEVKWAEEKKAVLHFKSVNGDGKSPESTPAGLPEAVHAHLSKFSEADPPPPMTIPVKNLEQYVVIKDDEQDQAQSVAESPYDRVELFWPLPLCRDGVEVIDSPGLNEHGARTKITTEYLSQADAVLFVLSCQALASESERRVIENQIRAAGHEEIFFIANRFDQVRKRERERIVEFGKKKLGKYTAFGTDGVFFMSALDALEGRLDDDEEMVAESGILPFEQRLMDFLANERGKVKLLRPAREAVNTLRETKDRTIPEQKKMLELGLKELEERAAAARPLLESAEKRQARIMARIGTKIQMMEKEVKRATAHKLESVVAQVPEWGDTFESSTTINMMKFWSVKEDARAFIEEFSEYISKQIDEEVNRWQTNELMPLVQQRLAEMADDIHDSVDEFLKELEGVSVCLTGIASKPEEGVDEVSPLERILAAAGGFIIGGAGSALVGSTLGFKEMLKSLGPQIALVVAAIVLGLTNPLFLIPMLLGGGAIQAMLKGKKILEDLKKKASTEIATKLREDAVQIQDDIVKAILERFQPTVDAINSGLTNEIAAHKQKVDSILNEMRQGAVAVDKKRQSLREAAKTAADLDNRLVEFVFSLTRGV